MDDRYGLKLECWGHGIKPLGPVKPLHQHINWRVNDIEPDTCLLPLVWPPTSPISARSHIGTFDNCRVSVHLFFFLFFFKKNRTAQVPEEVVLRIPQGINRRKLRQALFISLTTPISAGLGRAGKIP